MITLTGNPKEIEIRKNLLEEIDDQLTNTPPAKVYSKTSRTAARNERRSEEKESQRQDVLLAQKHYLEANQLMDALMELISAPFNHFLTQVERSQAGFISTVQHSQGKTYFLMDSVEKNKAFRIVLAALHKSKYVKLYLSIVLNQSPQAKPYTLLGGDFWQEACRGQTTLNKDQQSLVEKVKEAMALKIVSYRQAVEYIESTYPNFLPENIDNGVDGGRNQTEVTGAWKYINATFQQERETATKTQLDSVLTSHGHRIGTITPNDGKQLRGSHIDKINRNGSYDVIGSRGRNKYSFNLTATSLERAILRGQPTSTLAQRLTDKPITKQDLSRTQDSLF